MDNQHKITGLHLTYALDSGDGVKKNVQPERPRRWNIRFIRNFMITFGILSSVFDFLTFVVLLFILHAGTDMFRTGWFIESVNQCSRCNRDSS